MAKEIERKFLVVNESYKLSASRIDDLKQGYISLQKESTVRIRIKNDSAFLTIKGMTMGMTRDEWEYAIPVDAAEEMLSKIACGRIIDKTRYIVPYGNHTWEIDEFHGYHEGLVVAEIELKAEDESFPLPPFIGKEVTGDAAYYNSTLAGN
ncbi:MAG: CYTH domain-containing protein [Muribaculaceae bacterium]|nr:CYTH domain-containing protein [Muribaculaceae bacterium]